MLKRIATSLWGKFESKEEVLKFTLLAIIFSLIIGTYWTLRPIKDSIFGAIVGFKQWQPVAKWLSVCVSVPLVIFYSKLVDKFPRHKVFYMITGTYAVVALIIAWYLMSPTTGISSPLAPSPYRIIGWVWYIFVESFGSLIVALFWAITSDITKPDAARRGFPIIAMFGQLGNVFGPYFLNTKNLGLSDSAPIVVICAGMIVMIGILMWIFMRVTPKSQLVGYEEEGIIEKEEEAGFLEGLKLLVSRGYLMGIFAIVSIYEIIVTVFDYLFKSILTDTFPTEALRSAELSKFAYTTGIVSALCVLFGINNIQRKLGLKASLILLPLLVAVAMVMMKLNPGSLAIAFWVMVFAKAVNYALNQPTLKQLYIPTSKDAKYKSQSWIEMFGGRSAKGIGSGVNFLNRFMTLELFLTSVTLISFGLVTGWIFIALYVSKLYSKAIKEKTVVC